MRISTTKDKIYIMFSEIIETTLDYYDHVVIGYDRVSDNNTECDAIKIILDYLHKNVNSFTYFAPSKKIASNLTYYYDSTYGLSKRYPKLFKVCNSESTGLLRGFETVV